MRDIGEEVAFHAVERGDARGEAVHRASQPRQLVVPVDRQAVAEIPGGERGGGALEQRQVTHHLATHPLGREHAADQEQAAERHEAPGHGAALGLGVDEVRL